MRGKAKFVNQIIADYIKLVDLGAKPDTLEGLAEFYRLRTRL